MNLPKDKMPEAEVSLRLAFYLISNKLSTEVSVSIDGAMVRTKTNIHFQILDFLSSNGWKAMAIEKSFQGRYSHPEFSAKLEINSNPGKGDVVATLLNGKKFRAECKKGPMVKSKSSVEYKLLHEAIGQLMTISDMNKNDLLAVAVPHSLKFNELIKRWREAPLIKKLAILLLTVDRGNNVDGFPVSRK
jgi:hypothetical protein